MFVRGCINPVLPKFITNRLWWTETVRSERRLRRSDGVSPFKWECPERLGYSTEDSFRISDSRNRHIQTWVDICVKKKVECKSSHLYLSILLFPHTRLRFMYKFIIEVRPILRNQPYWCVTRVKTGDRCVEEKWDISLVLKQDYDWDKNTFTLI